MYEYVGLQMPDVAIFLLISLAVSGLCLATLLLSFPLHFQVATCTVGWVDIGTGTKVPLRFVTYLSKVTKINEKSVLTQ
jgi:hypothetical protein